ncbi:MAG: hypothetical protein HY328_03735 [Chloroflexi bacterium]|nr:hypothetical protein [Chloroflexota bacterium]
MIDLHNLRQRTGPILLVALTGLTLLLRVWDLNAVPPWLWWDEATQGLDARSLLGGHFRIFFPSAMGKEPLYIYLTTPFVAVWDGQPMAVRLTGALSGALMVPSLYYAARSLWPRQPAFGLWAGVAAAGFWATNFWPQSINRIGFQVNPFPLLLTLAVIAWLNYTRRPSRTRALTFGALAGLTLMTYIAARVTPLLWIALYLALPGAQRRALRPTLPWALLLGSLVIAPLALHFAQHPGDFFQRMGSFETMRGDLAQVTFEKLWWSLRQWVGGFLGVYGDPIVRHNIPDRPPFTLPVGALFAIGAGSALAVTLRRRDQAGVTLLLWWVTASIAFLASATNAPHFTRLFGALPPALLLAAMPIGWLAERLKQPARLALGGLLALLLAFEGMQMTRAYFITWTQRAELYGAYQGDTWAFGQRVAETHDAVGVAALNPGYGEQWAYAFARTPLHQLSADEGDVEGWLAARFDQAEGQLVMTPVWSEGGNLSADPRHALPFYLEREGALQAEEALRGFQLLTFRLGEQPQFAAAGQSGQPTGCPYPCPLPPDLTLVAGRWGAAYPSPNRDGDSSAAGAPLWAVLTWRSTRPLSDARVAVELVDSAGHWLAADEEWLLEETGVWSPAATFQTYHLLTVPVTQPPGEARLRVRVYDAKTLTPLLAGTDRAQQSIPLGVASMTPPMTPVDAAALPLDLPLPYTVAPGIELLGAAAWPATANAGQTITLRLYWRLGGPSAPQSPLRVALAGTAVRADVVLPTGTQAGQIIHTDTDLLLPADTPAGSYALRLTAGEEAASIALGSLDVANRPRQFEPPVLAHPLANGAIFGEMAQLLGLTSAPEAAGQSISVAAGQPVTLTLAWRALETPPRDLVRFIHVLGADGRPVAQEDSPPCASACPATSWLPGEVFVEQARLTLPVDLPAGSYPLAVGWYDATTLRRLPAAGATDSEKRVAPDMALLPVKLILTR